MVATTTKPKDQYQQRQGVDFADVPKQTNSTRGPTDKPDMRFTTHYEPINGAGWNKISYRIGECETWMGGVGPGAIGWQNDGEFRCELGTGGGIFGTGGWDCAINGTINQTTGGACATRSGKNVSHAATGPGGIGNGADSAGGKTTTAETKTSGDTHAAAVFPGDCGVVVPGVLGIGAGSMNIKSEADLAINTVEGSCSLTSHGNSSFGSQKGTCQIGGNGVAVHSQKTTSLRAVGNFSAFSEGGNFYCSGKNIYLNCSTAPPETPEQVHDQTKFAGKDVQPYTSAPNPAVSV